VAQKEPLDFGGNPDRVMLGLALGRLELAVRWGTCHTADHEICFIRHFN